MNDLSSLNIAGLANRDAPAGPSKSDDTALFTTGTVYETDPEGGRVRVGVLGGTVWLPAIADRYSSASLARVMVSPYTARPVLVAGAVRPRQPAVLGKIISGPSGGNLTVEIEGKQWVVPAPMGAYTVGNTAWIMLDEWGTPFLSVGPSAAPQSGDGTVAPRPAQATETATATIGPQVSGTWSVRNGRWDAWNVGRYGGASDIYQSEAYGSGKLIGFAGYGDQIANLGAVSIDEIVLRARKTDTNGLSAALSVQGTAAGSRPGGAPGGAGDTVSTGSIAAGAWGDVALTAAMREAFRTGAVRGLVAVGNQYGAFGGTGEPGSFVLQVRYTRNI